MKISIMCGLICFSLACVQEMGIFGHLSSYGALDNKPVARALPEFSIAWNHNEDLNNNEKPTKLSRDLLERGRERYNIFCKECHGLSGFGDGLVVKRGFTAPPSFHQERLRIAPLHHLFKVIRDGFGRMYGYSDVISDKDAWAIAEYIRVLQLSQNTHLKDLQPKQRARILQEIK